MHNYVYTDGREVTNNKSPARRLPQGLLSSAQNANNHLYWTFQ